MKDLERACKRQSIIAVKVYHYNVFIINIFQQGQIVGKGGDGEEVGCTKASVKEKDRCAVGFKVCCINADWPGKDREKVTGLDQ